MWICSVAAGKCRKSRDAKHGIVGMLTSGKVPLEKTLMTSLRRISAMLYRCTRQQDWPAKRYSSIYCAYGSVQRVQDWRGR